MHHPTIRSRLEGRAPRRLPALLVLTLGASLLATAPLGAQKHPELGRMWTLEDAPLDWFEEAYGVRPTKEWMDHVRLSALRFGDGCSASFVSPKGLILTNHHCARSHVANVTPEGQNWLKTGFFAKSTEDEVPVPGLVVRQLVEMRDVTKRINSGIAAGADAKAQQAAISKARNEILRGAKEEFPAHEAQVVSLYQGGMYKLYIYKVYRDIRLVAAPQMSLAKFGGDPDNFTYPRWSLDFSMLRAWDGDQPADTSKHYLKWKTTGPADGETVFVVGNPGSTGRLETLAQMEVKRDIEYPRILQYIGQQIAGYEKQLEKKPDDPKLQAAKLRMENGRKAYGGYLDGLRNEKVMAIKRKAEQAIRAKLETDEALNERFGKAFETIEAIMEGARNGKRPNRTELEIAQKKIGEAFFAVYGTEIPPDATFTLRISDGVVKGFAYNGTVAPYFTSLYGLFGRSIEFGGKAPFDLPNNWLSKQADLDLSTPFNLVCTNDITGGNSGSPLINAKGELVGLVFDGNIESLANNFVFTDEVARTVAVHPAIIIESLRKIYSAGKLADELEGNGTVR